MHVYVLSLFMKVFIHFIDQINFDDLPSLRFPLPCTWS